MAKSTSLFHYWSRKEFKSEDNEESEVCLPPTIDRFNRIRIENEKNREEIYHRRKIKILKVQGRPRGHSTVREVEHT